MNIAILDYSASEVRLIKNCPDSWEEEQIEEYIYGEDGLDLSESSTYYMCGDAVSIKQLIKDNNISIQGKILEWKKAKSEKKEEVQ